MRGSIVLTQRDHEVLDALTHRVRCFSVKQVARHWWGDDDSGIRSARRRLRQLADEALLELFDSFCREELELVSPLATWRPGEPQPDLGALAWQLASRWRNRPARRTKLVIAGKAATRLFGGHGGRRPRPAESTHDLHVAAIYLRLVSVGDARVKKWVSEAELISRAAGRSQKVPDAWILGKRRPPHIVEFGGEYPKQKLQAMHNDFASRGHSYEIW